MSLLLFVDLDTNLWWIRTVILLRGLAMGFCFVASQAGGYAEIAPSDNGRASAIFSTQRQMSVSIGIALTATVLSSFTTLSAAPSDPQRALTGYHWTFALATGLALLAAAVAFVMIRDEDARATMRARGDRSGDRRGRLLKALALSPADRGLTRSAR